jgi:hypothetical protein
MAVIFEHGSGRPPERGGLLAVSIGAQQITFRRPPE